MKLKKTVGLLLVGCMLISLCACFNSLFTVNIETPQNSQNAADELLGDMVFDDNAVFDPNAVPGGQTAQPAGETAPPSATAAPTNAAPEATAPTNTPVPATDAPTEPATQPAPTAKTPDQMTYAELLAFFNDSLNRIKTEKVGFKKSKLTAVKDLQLSNAAANSLVSIVKGALLSEKANETTVSKGQSSDNVFSPSGKPYVSQLQLSDLSGMKCVKSGNNYVILLGVKSETNPGSTGSIMSRGFDFMTVDDVVNTYAPKVRATVQRENVQVDFSGCTAKLTVTADGQVLAYETYVMGVMKMKQAKMLGLTTDLTITLASTTTYSDFSY